MWSDNETIEDLLGFKVHSDLICSIVTDTNLLPITIGVFGDWGSGKTSIMKMLQHDLNPENHDESEKKEKFKKIACLYFNGWLFEGYDDAKSAIISSILLQLSEHERFSSKIGDKAKSLLKSVNWMRLAKFGFKEVAIPAFSAYATGGASLIPSAINKTKGLIDNYMISDEEQKDPEKLIENLQDSMEKLEGFIKKGNKLEQSPLLEIRNFRQRFSEIIEKCEIDSLIVLIDDLDRCSPDRIIDNLEAIKLFLNVENTAFVIGADPRIIKHAIRSRYIPEQFYSRDDLMENGDRLINDYLEKLIQVPYHLPRLSPAEIETYISLLFCSDYLDEDEWLNLIEASKKQRQDNRYAVFGYGSIEAILGVDNLSQELADNLRICSSIAPLITEGVNVK